MSRKSGYRFCAHPTCEINNLERGDRIRLNETRSRPHSHDVIAQSIDENAVIQGTEPRQRLPLEQVRITDLAGANQIIQGRHLNCRLYRLSSKEHSASFFCDLMPAPQHATVGAVQADVAEVFMAYDVAEPICELWFWQEKLEYDVCRYGR